MPSWLPSSPLQGFSAPTRLPTKSYHDLAREESCPSMDRTLPSSMPKSSPTVPIDLKRHGHCQPTMIPNPLLTQARNDWRGRGGRNHPRGQEPLGWPWTS